MSRQKTNKRNVFSELMEGVGAMKEHRKNKMTLRTHKFPVAEVKESPGAEFFVSTREKFNVSRAVWANMLRVSPRTVEKWEQGGQVSPLAATFVELVSQYPDTIERLQTLPKRISRSNSKLICLSTSSLRSKTSAKVSVSSVTDKLRAHFRPKRIKILFVGEAPPSGGTFFYAANSQMYRYLKEALQSHLGNPHNFLEAFKEYGYFLDDLALEPVDDIPLKQRTPIYQQSVPLLSQRIIQYEPEVIVTLLKRISPYVEDAISWAGVKVRYDCAPFPGNGQQANFRRRMGEIVPFLR